MTEEKKDLNTRKVSLSDRVMASLEHSCLRGITHKIEIGTSSIYVKTAWFDGKLVNIDITLSSGGKDLTDDLPKSSHQVNLEMTIYDVARCWLEDSGRLASELLRVGVSVDSIIEKWRGTNGFPSGACPVLKEMGGELVYKGPLSAVATLLEKKMPEWSEMMSPKVPGDVD